MSNSIGHGFNPTDEPNLSKLNKQAKSLVAIAADCGWRVRQNPLGMIALETGLVGGEHGYRQIIVPTTSTRGPWAISNLRKVLLYGTQNTAKYQAGLAELGDRGLQLSELIKWTQSYDPDAEPVATEPEAPAEHPLAIPTTVVPPPVWVRDDAPAEGLFSPATVEPEHVHVPDEPEDGGPIGDQPLPADTPTEDGGTLAEVLLPASSLVAAIAGLVADHTAGQAARIADLEAELESERAARRELEDNLNALGDLIGQIRRT